jgi:CheY-like chemotaxis protein
MCSASRSKATVLIVEDDAISRELLTQLLLAGGYDVIATSTGEQALLSLCKVGDDIDWLVSKVILPGLVCGWILADEYHVHHPHRPVLLISAAPEPVQLSPEKVVMVPPAAPMRALEVLQALKNPELACVLPFRGSRAA